ncbi:MAG: hypothetical protein ACT4PE_08680 [Candidatus Eiseniibacteriota bacterium]
MKQLLTILALVTLVMTPPAEAARYIWTISSLATNPLMNVGEPTGGIMTLYLWLWCALDGGASAAEFDIAGPAGSVLAFTPINGFLNAGGTTNLLLATPCNAGPVVAGSWLCLSLPGEFCLVPSVNGKNVSVDCIVFAEHPNQQTGFANGVSPTCVSICDWSDTESASWGRVKSLFRR